MSLTPPTRPRCRHPWRRALFAALCQRYGLHLHRHARQQRQTVMLCAPPSFVDRVTEALLAELRPGYTREVSLAMVDGYGGAEHEP